MRTDRGLDRFITFLDAVVAIAMTLLVLPLTELLGGTDLPARSVDVFTQNAPRFWAFLLSFAVIGRLWVAHHRIVERVGAYDGAFVLVNLCWVLTVVFLPFATQLTSAYPATDRLPVAVYLGTLTLSAVFLSVAAVLVWRRPALRREGVEAKDAAPWAALVTTAVFLIALVLGTAVSWINYYALLLPLLASPVERRLGLVRPPG